VAEVPNIDETKLLLEFSPDRIGHGTCIYADRGGDQELVDTMLQAKIPLGIVFPNILLVLCCGCFQ
jgi:hypothetical protein